MHCDACLLSLSIMFSSFFGVVICISVSFLFLGNEEKAILFQHMDSSSSHHTIDFCFHFLAFTNHFAVIFTYKVLCRCSFSFPLGVYLGVYLHVWPVQGCL